jgi:hypothetical protein
MDMSNIVFLQLLYCNSCTEYLFHCYKGCIYIRHTERQILSDRKVMQPIPNTCSICQKINYTEIRKQKTMLY